jgi:hypothetical protein
MLRPRLKSDRLLGPSSTISEYRSDWDKEERLADVRRAPELRIDFSPDYPIRPR